jgi:hypothetical protein
VTYRKKHLSPQQRIVLSQLATGAPFTPLSALTNFGVGRLAPRIEELRKIGFPITTKIKRINNHKYASYTLNRKACRKLYEQYAT